MNRLRIGIGFIVIFMALSVTYAGAAQESFFYKATPCRFDTPRRADVSCGDLIVPEDRSDAESPAVRLHVAVFHSFSLNPEPDPVVYLEGGPGFSPLVTARDAFRDNFAPFLQNRDLIVIDQRGVGYSEPSLICPEYDTGSPRAIFSCWRRLEDNGIRLTHYTSAESAADLDDLRQALGYEQWNLYGASYGTRLALTTMRDYPNGLRSVILDAVYPPQANLYTELPASIDRAFRVLFHACATSTECNTAYPDLEKVFYDQVQKLTQEPANVSLNHFGSDYSIPVTAYTLINYLFQSLYDVDLIPNLPEAIYNTNYGDYDAVLGLQSPRFDLLFSAGLYYALQCTEEVPFSTIDEWHSAIAAYPQLIPFFDRSAVFGLPIYEVCDALERPDPDPAENEPVVSDVPTLLMVGEYDPVTPPSWAIQTAKTLTNGMVFVYPGMGHTVFSVDACPQGMALSFLDDPTHAPDASCINSMNAPHFTLP